MNPRHDRYKTQETEGQMKRKAFWLLGNLFEILADQTDTEGRYDLIESRPPAGHQTPPHRATAYTEQIYVLDRELTVWAGRRKVLLHAGEAFTIRAGTAHVTAATGGSPAHGLVIASPNGFARLIQETGAPDTGSAPPGLSPEDIERFTQAAAEMGEETLGPPGALPEA